MRHLIAVATMMLLTQAQPQPQLTALCNLEVVHPYINATNNAERTVDFMKGITFVCPAGTKLVMPPNGPVNMTPSVVLNITSRATCK